MQVSEQVWSDLVHGSLLLAVERKKWLSTTIESLKQVLCKCQQAGGVKKQLVLIQVKDPGVDCPMGKDSEEGRHQNTL